MSILIDDLVSKTYSNCFTRFGNALYIAKPIPYKTIQEKFKRIRDAWRVIKGKSFAVHYKIDE